MSTDFFNTPYMKDTERKKERHFFSPPGLSPKKKTGAQKVWNAGTRPREGTSRRWLFEKSHSSLGLFLNAMQSIAKKVQ